MIKLRLGSFSEGGYIILTTKEEPHKIIAKVIQADGIDLVEMAHRMVDCVNGHDDIILALKCVEADLCGLLSDHLGLSPEEDDQTDHPAIKTIHEIRQILASE